MFEKGVPKITPKSISYEGKEETLPQRASVAVSKRSPGKPNSTGRNLWTAFKILFVGAFLALLIGIVYIWSNRVEFLENQIQSILKDKGYAATFDIETLTRTKAVLNNVSFAISPKNDEPNPLETAPIARPFLTVETVVLEYAWREALNGHVDKITLKSLNLFGEIDSQGNLITPILPKGAGGGAPIVFPRKGVKLENAKLFLDNPAGRLEVLASAQISDMETWIADLAFISGSLSVNNGTIEPKGQLGITAKESVLQLKPDLNIVKLQTSQWDMTNGLIKGALEISPYQALTLSQTSNQTSGQNVTPPIVLTAKGQLDLKFKAFTDSNYDLERGHITGDLTTRVQINPGVGTDSTEPEIAFPDIASPDIASSEIMSPEIRAPEITLAESANKRVPFTVSQMSGIGSLDIGKLSILSDEKRRAYADILSLKTALSKPPMVKNFAHIPNTALNRLLSNMQVSVRSELSYDKDGYAVTLLQPLKLKGEQDSLIVSHSSQRKSLNIASSPAELVNTAFNKTIHFDKALSVLNLEVDISLFGPSALSIKTLKVVAKSLNGIHLERLQSARAHVNLPQVWVTKTEDGRPVRLKPFTAMTEYLATPSKRTFTLDGPFEYDGDVPGGYVTGLKANGRTQVVLKSDRTDTHFIPKLNHALLIERFENTTDWRGENLELLLSSDGGRFTQRGPVGRVSADVRAVKGDLKASVNQQKLAFKTAEANIIATISDDLQNWRVRAKDTHILSPDLPKGGSQISAPSSDLVFRLRAEKDPEFTLKAESTNVFTESVKVINMELNAKGTAQDFILEYSKGQVKFATDDLPTLPFAGEVRYRANPGVSASYIPTGQTNAFKPALWTGVAQTFLPKADATPIDVRFEFSDGAGLADVSIEALVFKPGQLQPQTYVKALKGKVSQVDGTVGAKLKVEFSPNEPLKSSGTVSLKDLGMGTLTGPFMGINSELTFSSMFPLQSTGRQFLTANLFDPGFPLEAGEFQFEIIPDGVRLYSAKWPLGGGVVSLDPTDWIYTAPQNKVVLRLENISLEALTTSLGKESFQATGIMEGELPVTIEGIKTEVVGGVIRVKDGGVIKFQNEHTDAAGAKNEIAATAFDALKDFEYKKLEAYLDGPLDGNLIVKMEFDGKNKDILGGAVFAWLVTLEGELLNIARSFNPENMNAIYKRLAKESAQKSP